MILVSTLRGVVPCITCALVCLPAMGGSQTYKGSSPHTWVAEKWRTKGGAYAQVQQEIDSALARGKDPMSIFSSAKAAAGRTVDAKAQFRYAYSFYKAGMAKPTLYDGSELTRVLQRFEVPPNPKVYEYTRIRFLLSCSSFPDRAYMPLGEALLKEDPRDTAVMYQLSKVYWPSKSQAERKRALELANGVIKLEPKEHKGYIALASVYYRAWRTTKSRSDAHASIANYKKYLQLYPDSPYRDRVEKLIQRMRA